MNKLSALRSRHKPAPALPQAPSEQDLAWEGVQAACDAFRTRAWLQRVEADVRCSWHAIKTFEGVVVADSGEKEFTRFYQAELHFPKLVSVSGMDVTVPSYRQIVCLAKRGAAWEPFNPVGLEASADRYVRDCRRALANKIKNTLARDIRAGLGFRVDSVDAVDGELLVGTLLDGHRRYIRFYLGEELPDTWLQMVQDWLDKVHGQRHLEDALDMLADL